MWKFWKKKEKPKLTWEQRYFHYGVDCELRGDISGAIANYDESIRFNPNYADAWNNRGTALVKLGRHEDAIASFDNAIDINPNYADAWNNRGTALVKLGWHEDAIASFDKAIAIKPNYADARNNLKIIKMNEKLVAKKVILEPHKELSKYNKDILNSLKQYVLTELLTELIKCSVMKNNYVQLRLPGFNTTISFRVIDIEPEAAVIITHKTVLEFSDNTDILINNKKTVRNISSNIRCKNCREKIYREEIIRCGPCGGSFCIFCWESHRWSHGKSPAIGISYQSDGTFSGFDGTERLK